MSDLKNIKESRVEIVHPYLTRYQRAILLSLVEQERDRIRSWWPVVDAEKIEITLSDIIDELRGAQ